MFMKSIFIKLVLPICIPMIFIILFGNISYNEKIKKILLMVVSFIYNFIFGALMFLIKFVFLSFFGDFIKNTIVAYIMILLIYIILIVPINIFVLKKTKFNPIIYIITNIGLIFWGYNCNLQIAKETSNPFWIFFKINNYK